MTTESAMAADAGGGSFAQREHAPLLRGRGRYLDDVDAANTLHVAFVRSAHAHARLVGVDVAAARALPGVVAVLVAGDLAGRVDPIVARMDPDGDYRYRHTSWPVLAGDRVRYVGEAIAAVVAEDRYAAEDAAEAVVVDYEPLPALTDADASLAEGAPSLHAEAPDNVLFHIARSHGAVEHCFDAAPVRLQATFKHPRLAGLSMEGCGVLARYHPSGDRLEVWSSTQIPHLLRDGLSRSLRMPAGRIRVIAPDVGGAFGIKMQLLPEEVVVAFAARRLGRPVKWVQDRSEHLLASFHAREVRVSAEIAADESGTLLGVRARVWCDVGAYSSFPLTCSLEPQTIATGLAGPYRLSCFQYEAQAVATNKCPGGAYRGVGFPLGPLVIETLLDRLARRLGRDPVEIRRRNLLTPEELPYATASGAVYDSGDYPDLLARAMEAAGYEQWRRQQAVGRTPDSRRRLGVGVACFVEATGMNRRVYRGRGMVEIPAFESAALRVAPDGTIHAALSTPTQGQGHLTTFARLLAERLGVDPARVAVTLGDTDTTPYGAGTFGSRSVVSAGGALLAAADALMQRLCRLAAAHWQADPAEVSFAAGKARLGEAQQATLSLDELAALAYSPLPELPQDCAPGLEVSVAHDTPGVAFSCSTHLVLVEVDADTGQVKILRYVVAEDCGPMINPPAVEGQVRGAVAQGIGSALFESVVYDDQGQHITATLQDYLVPGSTDVPDVEIVHAQTASPFTRGGHKGVGESGTIGAPAAIASAVLDALGVEPQRLELPLTPERVHGLVQEVEQ